MKNGIENRSQGLRQVLAAIIVVCVLVLTGMAEPQLKRDLSNNLPPDLSSVRQHSSFTPFY